jgi:hypothetical protein
LGYLRIGSEIGGNTEEVREESYGRERMGEEGKRCNFRVSLSVELRSRPIRGWRDAFRTV